MSNHALWVICPKCYEEFDARFERNKCPKCHYKIPHRDLFAFLGKMLTIIIIILIIVWAFSSCQPYRYNIRQRHNRLQQKITQSRHDYPACKDPLKTYNLWAERPQGHWPIQFLMSNK